jgi:hypothetical protein
MFLNTVPVVRAARSRIVAEHLSGLVDGEEVVGGDLEKLETSPTAKNQANRKKAIFAPVKQITDKFCERPGVNPTNFGVNRRFCW